MEKIINRKLISLLSEDFKERNWKALDLAITPYVYNLNNLKNEHVLREIKSMIDTGKYKLKKLKGKKGNQLSIIVLK